MNRTVLLLGGVVVWAAVILVSPHDEALAEPNLPAASFGARQTVALEKIAEGAEKLKELEKITARLHELEEITAQLKKLNDERRCRR